MLELEVEGAEAFKSKCDCLTIFLEPPSIPVFEQRLRARLTEEEAVLEGRAALAAQQLAEARECGVFDGFLVNDNADKAYNDLKALIAQFRPDLVAPARDEVAAEEHRTAAGAPLSAAARRAAGGGQAPLVLVGPPGAAGPGWGRARLRVRRAGCLRGMLCPRGQGTRRLRRWRVPPTGAEGLAAQGAGAAARGRRGQAACWSGGGAVIPGIPACRLAPGTLGSPLRVPCQWRGCLRLREPV